MTNMSNYLTQFAEPLPAWLKHFKATSPVDMRSFFEGRVLYYPGAGLDGHPVKLFGQAHAVHCFVYADYGISPSTVKAELESPTHRFKGYRTFSRRELAETDLLSGNWKPHVTAAECTAFGSSHVHTPPFAFLEILEREPHFGDDHGPARLAILFLGSDGIAGYDAMFCQTGSVRAPWAALLQDHGFGGNYDRFGRGGLMERIAIRSGVFPEWLLVAENTTAWTGFKPLAGISADAGGMHFTARKLYRRNESDTGQ